MHLLTIWCGYSSNESKIVEQLKGLYKESLKELLTLLLDPQFQPQRKHLFLWNLNGLMNMRKVSNLSLLMFQDIWSRPHMLRVVPSEANRIIWLLELTRG